MLKSLRNESEMEIKKQGREVESVKSMKSQNIAKAEVGECVTSEDENNNREIEQSPSMTRETLTVL